MSLKIKSDENKRIAEKCLTLKAYNAGASRAYYSAYQKAKSYLIENNFDLEGFLCEIGEEKDTEYRHGQIQSALIKCLMDKGKTIPEISKINIWDNLYRKRIIADYKDNMIGEIELKIILDNLNIISDIISL